MFAINLNSFFRLPIVTKLTTGKITALSTYFRDSCLGFFSQPNKLEMPLSGRLDFKVQLNTQELIWQQMPQTQMKEYEIPTAKHKRSISHLSLYRLLTFIQINPLILTSVSICY